jgi:hypothetical protein
VGRHRRADNPAARDVAITFDRGDRGSWTLELFDMAGSRIAVLAAGEEGDVGRYRADIALGSTPAGSYLVRLRCGIGADTGTLEAVRLELSILSASIVGL